MTTKKATPVTYEIEGHDYRWDPRERRMRRRRTFRSTSLEAATAEANRIFRETGIVVAVTKVES